MCNILRAKFLHNQQSITCDNEVVKSVATHTHMLSILLQRPEEVFPALKESSLSMLHRKLIYQLLLWSLHYPVYSTYITSQRQLGLCFMQMFSLSMQFIMFAEIFPYPKLGALEFLRISRM